MAPLPESSIRINRLHPFAQRGPLHLVTGRVLSLHLQYQSPPRSKADQEIRAVFGDAALQDVADLEAKVIVLCPRRHDIGRIGVVEPMGLGGFPGTVVHAVADMRSPGWLT